MFLSVGRLLAWKNLRLQFDKDDGVKYGQQGERNIKKYNNIARVSFA